MPGTAVPGRLSGLSVLVVEDETLLAIDYEAMLKREGCRVMGPAPREDIALGSTFADTFDDEPTTLDPPEYSAISAPSDVVEESSEFAPPTPAPEAPTTKKRPARITGRGARYEGGRISPRRRGCRAPCMTLISW